MTALETWSRPRTVKLRVEDFLHLHEAGAFRDYAKTELIGGTIVAMNAQMSLHARTKTRLLRIIADAADAVLPGYEALSEVSVGIPPSDVPEPDIVVTSFEADRRAVVPVETIILLVEVADTTLRFDRSVKERLYARARVPEYWVADVNARVIHQMWAPEGEDYIHRREVPFGEPLFGATLEGFRIETQRL